jgi:ligand-binding sensor domain-containing protein/signal transduction histidine kinase
MRAAWGEAGALVLSLVVPVCAARLPCRVYTVADGLPNNYTTAILPDTRGLVWIGTTEGLARFDGTRFRTYDARDGLPHPVITSIKETRDGTLWVGTGRGLCRLLPRQENGRLFQCYAPGPNRADSVVLKLFEDSKGGLWLGTNSGVFRVLRADGGTGAVRFEKLDLGFGAEETDFTIRGFCEHPSGEMWASGGGGLFRWRPGGKVERFTTKEGLPQNQATRILCDSRGRVWAGFWDSGLVLLAPSPMPGRPIVERTYRAWGTELSSKVVDLFETSDGRILATTTNALTELEAAPGTRELRARRFGKKQGLGSDLIGYIAEDREGNLWLTSSDAGVTKILRRGFVTYGVEDGIPNPDTYVLMDVEGAGLVASRGGYLYRFDGTRFETVRLNLPREMFVDAIQLGWGWSQWIVRDSEGDWWVPTERGIFRYGPQKRIEDLAAAKPKAHYTVKDGLPSNGIFRLFEDSRGDIWISLLGTDEPVAVWLRRQGKFIRHEIRTEKGARQTLAATAFAEDRHGQIWAGFYAGGLARHRNGRWDYFGAEQGGPAGFVDALLVDRRGRLWVGSGDGLRRVDQPGSEKPGFLRYGREHGLPTQYVTALAEDHLGRIYVGMHSRVARLEADDPPQAGPLRLRHYTTAEGLPFGNIRTMICDRQGAIWTAGENGVARLEPETRQQLLPRPVRFMALKAGGVAVPLSEFGERNLRGYSISDRGGAVEVEFVAAGGQDGQGQRYSYLLEGSEGGWSAPVSGGRLTLAGLKAGRYRLMVRSEEDGDAVDPAVLEFAVTAPLYRRGWFAGLCAALAALGGFWIYRSRWKRALELERMRMQIATDLHDELGAALTQVALTSETARLSREAVVKEDALENVAGMAREMIGSLSDLVWTIRPRQERGEDLAARMRAVASEMLAAARMRLDFEASEEAMRARLDPEQRRQILAVFKESIHNAVRHSGGTFVRVRLEAGQGSLVLSTVNDGSPAQGEEGANSNGRHGIEGMRWRARMIGGSLEAGPADENGWRVTLRVPLRAVRKNEAAEVRGMAAKSGGEAA